MAFRKFLDRSYYYRESLQLFQTFPNGAYGKVYQVIGGTMQTYWTVPIYNRTLLAEGVKSRIGISKVNIGLQDIADFLSGLSVLQRGYVMMTEFDTDYVIGGSVNIPGLQLSRIPVQNVTDRNAGKIITKLIAKQREVNTDYLTTTIEESGVNYLVAAHPFEYYNIKWRMVLVFEESEIKKGIIMSSYVILGVSIGIGLVGVVISAIVGWIVTNPFFKLQQDFKKIELLDLDSIQQRTSLFSEANSIFDSLISVNKWLKEFKSFLPDSVLNTLQTTRDALVTTSVEESHRQSQRHSNDNASEQPTSAGIQSTHTYKQDVKNNLFALGLHTKDCTVLHMTLPNLNAITYHQDSLSDILSKVLTGVSTICKTVRADLQIKNYNEFCVVFVGKSNNTNLAMETALKIVAALDQLNKRMEQEGESPLVVNIGVATGPALQGNVGNKQLRYFSMIGSVVERAKDFSVLAQSLETQILVDSASMKLVKQDFVFRPVERYLEGESTHKIGTVYQLLRKSHVEHDEWLYELEKKNQNAKFEAFAHHFHNLFEKQSAVEELNSVREYLLQNEKGDKVMERIHSLIKSNNSQNFVAYHSED